ncbi:MAG: hypothetical protein INH41_28505 [Myxococcaceae bacterium]|nr:hypothetical protein [Myxococcaceae bacterium]
MAKTFEKAVTGFNHNIKHKGKVYHVQTEDSGVNNPHIITHLFVGGNILATKKRSYADLVSAPNLAETVRELMEEQHKQMLRNLIHGAYDRVENQGATAYQPGEIHTEAPKQPEVPELPLIEAELTPAALPPEVVAARALKEAPRENHVGIETLFGEDLISEKSLDEVILSYLAGESGS